LLQLLQLAKSKLQHAKPNDTKPYSHLLQLTPYFSYLNNIYIYTHTHMHTHTHYIYRGCFLLQAATNRCKPYHNFDTDDFWAVQPCCTLTKLQQL
jgi:hypothetical protein